MTAVDLGGIDSWQLVTGSAVTRLMAITLRRRSLRTVISISPPAWAAWRRRHATAIVLSAGSVGVIAAGALRGAGGVVILGIVGVIVGSLLRARAGWRHWVGVRYRPQRDEVIVSRVSARFGDDARRLFTDAVRRA